MCSMFCKWKTCTNSATLGHRTRRDDKNVSNIKKKKKNGAKLVKLESTIHVFLNISRFQGQIWPIPDMLFYIILQKASTFRIA